MNIYIDDLRRLVAKYNLHLNIRRYSKMRKLDLIDAITTRGWVLDSDKYDKPILRYRIKSGV